MMLNISVSAQSGSKFKIYANKVKSFSKPADVLLSTVNASGNGSVTLTNKENQVLRFRVYKHKPGEIAPRSHSGIVYQLFIYNNNYLQRVETFDLQGNLTGQNLVGEGDESDHEAITEYIIEKPESYLVKKKLMDDAEGNIIQMPDDTNEKIIRIQLYDVNRQPITFKSHFYRESPYMSSNEYWLTNERIHWP
ncbi:hypothetical protein [Pedobacter sp. NJ-S-72]